MRFIFPERFFEIPPFISETKLPELRKKIQQIYDSGCRDFIASHWHAFEMLEIFQNIRIHAAFPFPVMNSQAVKTAASLGAYSAEIEPEINRSDRELLKNASILPLFCRDTPLPLLATRLELDGETDWENESGEKLFIEKNNGISEIFSKSKDPRNSLYNKGV